MSESLQYLYNKLKKNNTFKNKIIFYRKYLYTASKKSRLKDKKLLDESDSESNSVTYFKLFKFLLF